MEISDLRPGVVYKLNLNAGASIFYIDIKLSMKENVSNLNVSNRQEKIRYFTQINKFVYTNKTILNETERVFPIFLDLKTGNHFIFVFCPEKMDIEEI